MTTNTTMLVRTLKELTLEFVTAHHRGSLRKLPLNLRQEINMARFSRRSDKNHESDSLYEEVVGNYCFLRTDDIDELYHHYDSTVGRYRFMKAHTKTNFVSWRHQAGDLYNAIPTIDQPLGAIFKSGLVYDPKAVLQRQPILTLCEVEARCSRYDGSGIISVETFLTQQRLRQLQALVLPLVRPLTRINNIHEKEISHYVYDIEPPEEEQVFYARKFAVSPDSIFERISRQYITSLAQLNKLHRRKINLLRFDRIEGWVEKLTRNIVALCNPRPVVVKARRPYSLPVYHLPSHTVTYVIEESDRNSEFLYSQARVDQHSRAVIGLSEACFQTSGPSSPSNEPQLTVDPHPPKRKIRRLQALLLPLVQPLVSLRDIPIDIDYSKYIE